MNRLAFALALLSAPLFASSTTIPEAPRHAADLFLTGSQFQAENPGPQASWLVFSDSRGTVLTTTRIPSGAELRAEVPGSLLHELFVEVLTPTSLGIHRGERTLLTSLAPDPAALFSGNGTFDSVDNTGGGEQYAAHGGSGSTDDPDETATPPQDITPPAPPL